MKRTSTILILVTGALFLTACARWHVRVPVPARPMVFAGFEVVYGPNIPGDRQRLLNRHQAPGAMAAALRAAYPAGPGPLVRVMITQFRALALGQAGMHAVVQVINPAGQLLVQFETDSTTVRGSRTLGRVVDDDLVAPGEPLPSPRTLKIRAVMQDTVDQIAQRL